MTIKVGSMVTITSGPYQGEPGLVSELRDSGYFKVDLEKWGHVIFAPEELEEVVVRDDTQAERSLGIAIGYERAIRRLEAERNRQRHMHDDLMKVAMSARIQQSAAGAYPELEIWVARAKSMGDDAERVALDHKARSEALAAMVGVLRGLRDDEVEGFGEEQGRAFAEEFADDVPF